MNERRVFTSVGMLIAILALAVGLTQAQALDPQSPAAQQAALGNTFTYQGQLSDGGVPANGTYDFQFILYNALSGGSQVGSTVAKENVPVTDGLFIVVLDFGQVFDGTGLWLEAAVRPGSSTGVHTILSPRQEITPTPYASYAIQAYQAYRANGLSAPDGDPMDAATVNNDGTLIVSDLEVVRDDWATLDIRTSAVDKDAHIRLYDDSDYWGIHNDDSEGNNLNIRYNNSSKVWITPDGDMGIGANAPSAKLDVAGDIAQDLAANGVVKAGAYITFTFVSIPDIDCNIARSFTTVEGGAVSAPVGMMCIVDFDFDLSQRYWVAMATDSGLTATCDLDSDTTRLSCMLLDGDSLTNGNFMLLVY
ncbi:MAG: hypothetical protein JXR84_00560 [Anaerolineae bacterium]|nr:hypothetical protein [Anaerolineae bacterium]